MGQATYVACEVLRDGKHVAMKFLATEDLLKHILFGQESQVKVNITTAQVYCEEEKLTTDTKVEFKYRGWKYINDEDLFCKILCSDVVEKQLQNVIWIIVNAIVTLCSI